MYDTHLELLRRLSGESAIYEGGGDTSPKLMSSQAFIQLITLSLPTHISGNAVLSLNQHNSAVQILLFPTVPSPIHIHQGFHQIQITVAWGLKFHWYLRNLTLRFQNARTKIEVFLSLQKQENFKFGPSILKF